MAKAPPKGRYHNLLRFYGFALPYWKLIALSYVAMVVFDVVGVNTLLLVKPFVRSFEGAATAEQTAAPAEPPQDVTPGARQRAEPLGAVKDRAQQWVLNLPVVKTVVDWLWQGASLKRIALAFAFIIGPLFVAAGFAQEYLQGRVVWAVLADLRMAVFARLTRLSLNYYRRQRTGELLSRLTYDITRTEAALKVVFGKLPQQSLMLVALLATALWHSVQLTLAAAVIAPVLVLAVRAFGGQIRRRARKTLEKLADVTDSVTQMLHGIRVVKAFNMEEAETRAFEERNRAQLERAYKLVRTESWAGVVPQFLVGVCAGCLMLLAADYLNARGHLSFDNMLVCSIALGLTGGRLRRIVTAYNDIQHSLPSVDRVFELIDTEPDIVDSATAVNVSGVGEGVRYSNVWFAYDREPVLKGIDLFVPAGKTYAIVGETGAGKSTMLDLLPRFYDVTRGAVTIGGVDVRFIRRDSLMRQIAIVGQRPFLFNRSIAENIRYGKPNAADEEVVAAARAANIHDFVTGLAEGYETLAGEMGDRFSGGQRQCITIARAILKNAPILILDEATSSLDAQSEALVQAALENLMENRTTLVIAHRLSTVRHADQIVVLRDGCIVEQGTHAELMELGGEYRRLYHLQFAEDAGPRAEPDGRPAAPARPSDVPASPSEERPHP